MTIQELLKSANISEEVINGLPKEVASAFETHLQTADKKYADAQSLSEQAAEKLRIAQLQDKDVKDYVAQYGTALTEMASSKAQLKAYEEYLKSLKDQGFDLPAFTGAGSPATAAVAGSPAIGANAVDEKAILGKVGSFMAEWLDANNEHIRLYGTPIPDDSTTFGTEAAQARMSPREYAAKKYKFADKKAEIETARQQKERDEYATKKLEEYKRQQAEAIGSNPNLRPGVSSRNSFVPKIKGEDFHKSDGNQPQRERMRRVLDGVRKDIAASRDGVA